MVFFNDFETMRYSTDDFLKDVRVAYDENVETEAMGRFDDDATLRLEDIMRSKAGDALEEVALTAPLRVLDFEDYRGAAVTWDGETMHGRVTLPPNWLRQVSFKMSDWERACYQMHDASEALYGMQRASAAGVGGTWERPVCFVVAMGYDAKETDYAKRRQIEFFSCKSRAATVAECLYVARPVFDEAGMFEYSERAYRGAVLKCASLTALTYGNTNMGEVLEVLSQRAIGMMPTPAPNEGKGKG